MTLTVGFVGLGIMGSPMAVNLVRAGFDVIGYNRSRGPLTSLTEAGGRAAASVAEAARDSQVIITMLPDGPDVESVMSSPDGVLENAATGTLVIDCSSIAPATARAIALSCVARGLRPLDAPVSGGEQGAIDGTLSVMVGGEPEDFAAATPVLEAMGRTVVRVGVAGAGQTVKAANQLIVAGTIELVAEAMVFLEAHDVATDTALEVLQGGLAGSRVLERKGAAMIRREFTPGFRVELHHKDMGIVQAAAREAGVAIPLGALTAQLMGSVNAMGKGKLDHTALLALVEAMSGRTD
jgi:2-hydroxy-3-oxopropionate reductase